MVDKVTVIGGESGLLFRKAESRDRNAVLALYESVKGGELCPWNEYYPTALEADADLAAGGLFVLTMGDTLVGAGSIVPENELDGLDCWTSADASELARIAIAPATQGRGLAAVLVGRLLDTLRQRGCAWVHLSAAKGNIPALRTYERLGFVKVGERDMYGGSYYLYELKL